MTVFSPGRDEVLLPIGEEQRLETVPISKSWEDHVKAPNLRRMEPWGKIDGTIVRRWAESISDSSVDESSETNVFTASDFAPAGHTHDIQSITGADILTLNVLADWRVNEEDLTIEGRFLSIQVPVVSVSEGDWEVLHQGGTC